MGLYKNTNGVLSPIAGRGRAEYGASTVRTGTITSSNIPAFDSGTSYSVISVTFDTPMPDADYEVILTGDRDGYALTGYTISSKTKNGFKVGLDNLWSQSRPLIFTYKAFKLYTDNEYNNLLRLTRPDKWPANTEISFGDGLYGQRFTGTAAKTALASGGIALVSGVSKTACVFNWGGMIDMSGTNGNNWYNIGGSWDGTASDFRPLITNTSQVLRFYCETNQTAENYQYNIWLVYTK